MHHQELEQESVLGQPQEPASAQVREAQDLRLAHRNCTNASKLYIFKVTVRRERSLLGKERLDECREQVSARNKIKMAPNLWFGAGQTRCTRHEAGVIVWPSRPSSTQNLVKT